MAEIAERARAVKRRPVLLVAAFAVIATVLSGCQQKPLLPPMGPAGAQVGGTIRFGLTSQPTSLNPAFASWDTEGLEMARNIFDTLAAYDGSGGVQPFLAQRFEHNADYTQWTIVVRDNVYLTNGLKVTSEVVRRNQQHLKDTVTTKQPYDPIVSFATDGELRLVVTMKEPYPGYPYSLATQLGIVADPDWLDTANGDHPIGSGPFKLADGWVPGQQATLLRNPGYWRSDEAGTRLPYLNEVDFVTVTDPAARLNGLRAGTLDIVHTTDPHDVAAFNTRRDEFQVFTSKDLNSETPEVSIQLNGMDALFSDLEARQALALATDKDEITAGFGAGVVTPANGPYAPGSPWYAPNVATAYPQLDLTKARAAVTNVKARHGGQFTFVVNYVGTAPPAELVDLQAQWANVGITAQLVAVDSLTMMIHAFLGQYQSAYWRQFDSPNPIADSIWFHPRAVKPVGDWSMNFARNTDDEIGRLLDEARHTTDRNVQLADYQQVQVLLGRDVPYIWLYHGQLSVVANDKLVNVNTSTLPPNDRGVRNLGLPIQQGYHPLAEVWLQQ